MNVLGSVKPAGNHSVARIAPKHTTGRACPASVVHTKAYRSPANVNASQSCCYQIVSIVDEVTKREDNTFALPMGKREENDNYEA